MKKRLIIIGAGGLGREIFGYVTQNPDPDYDLAGFLDDDADALQGKNLPVGVLGSTADYRPGSHDVFLPGLGDPKTKLRLARRMLERGAKFANYIHPSAILGYRAKLGAGIFVFPGAIIAPYATIGDFVSIGGNATVGHDATIGDGCTLCGHAEINGWTALAEGVFLGSHATVLPKVKVGAFAVIGAASACISSVAPATTVIGVPAKRLLL